MSRRLVLQSVRLVVSCGRPGALPLAQCRLEPRLSACLQLHNFGRARNLLGRSATRTRWRCISASSLSRRAHAAPSSSEGAACEVGDELRRGGVEAADVEHPLVVRVGDREAVRDPADHDQPRVDGPKAALPVDNRAVLARDDLVLEQATGLGGADDPDRTGLPRIGAPVLFRVSYVREVVCPAGVEPAASAVAGQRSLG